jgi:hypothetical protein
LLVLFHLAALIQAAKLSIYYYYSLPLALALSIFKASGALKDSLENRLRKSGYVEGKDIPNIKRNHKPIRMTLYTITPKGRKLLKGWIGFLSTYS